MDLRLIKRIIKLVEESEINELEVEEGDLRISICKQGPVTLLSSENAPTALPSSPQIAQSSAQPSPSSSAESGAPSAGGEENHGDKSGIVIPSPMVGTFYRSPSPEDPAFAQVGSVVEPDTVVCILEAMKVMNEIKAGVSGKVVEVLVENGNPVEFGQPLFRVEP